MVSEVELEEISEKVCVLNQIKKRLLALKIGVAFILVLSLAPLVNTVIIMRSVATNRQLIQDYVELSNVNQDAIKTNQRIITDMTLKYQSLEDAVTHLHREVTLLREALKLPDAP